MTSRETPQSYFQRSCEAMQRAAADQHLMTAIDTVAGRITQALKAGNKLLLAGNGGSAADAQHIAAEFLSRFRLNRNPLPAIALTTDTSILTAIGNDFGFDHVFERQVRALGRRGDIFIGISTSGRSPNIVAALKAARENGVATIGMTGAKDGGMNALCDIVLAAPVEETALIQQIHITAAHVICEMVESGLFGAR